MFTSELHLQSCTFSLVAAVVGISVELTDQHRINGFKCFACMYVGSCAHLQECSRSSGKTPASSNHHKQESA